MRNNDLAVERGRFICSSGSPVKDIYSPIVLDDGSIELKVTGQVNTDEEIDSYAKSCSLEVILSKYANGDTSVLNRYQPLYLDLAEFPKTYADVLQHAINAERGFDNLPVDIKQKYDNDWHKWLAQAGSESWFADLGIVPEKVEEKGVVEE